jgi:hypothetical protein
MPLVCGLRAGGWIFLASGERNVEAAGAAGGRAVGARLSLSAARALPCRISLQWIKGLREFYAIQATARCHRPRSLGHASAHYAGAFSRRPLRIQSCSALEIEICEKACLRLLDIQHFSLCNLCSGMNLMLPPFLARGVLISNLTYDFEYFMDRRGNLWV